MRPTHAPSTPGHWLTRNGRAQALRPLSWLYGAVAGLQRQTYRNGWRKATRLPVPVVVVGNVVAGGAGKTPTTIAVVQHLKTRGWQPGIISRGYGRRTESGENDVLEVKPDMDARDTGDEPLLMARHTGSPVFVARKRAQAGMALLAHHPDVNILVCDDGLQHLALERDVEICVFDERGIGNGFLLPAGPLREPWPRGASASSATETALILHTGSQVSPALSGIGWHAPRKLAAYAVDANGQKHALDSLRGDNLVAIAAIARPQAFFDMLTKAGVTPSSTIALPDHYAFDAAFDNAFEQGTPPIPTNKTLICTEKDAVKLWPRMPNALAVPLTLDVPEPFWTALDQKLAPLHHATHRTQHHALR